MGVKIITLVKIASIGGILTCSMGMALRYKLNNDVKKTEFFKESMQILRRHKPAIHLLGEPIKDYTIEISDTSKNFVTHHSAKYEIPVKGSKQRGTLFIWINKISEDGNSPWVLNRIELGLKNDPDKRLVIK